MTRASALRCRERIAHHSCQSARYTCVPEGNWRMEHVRRVIVHDKIPVLEPDIFLGPTNRLVLGTAALSLLLQSIALGEVDAGQGASVGIFEHISFALVALLWLAL